MDILRILTAGESHGPTLIGVLEGMPAGLEVLALDLDLQLRRRQHGHGRGGRMKIEKDQVEILSGVRRGRTTGAPIAIAIKNRDFENWREVMMTEPGGDPEKRRVSVPRPGHADYQGALKYGLDDMRDVLERASARETAMRVALASVARLLLATLGITVASRVVAIGAARDASDAAGLAPIEINRIADASPVRALDDAAAARMVEEIDLAIKERDTLGGVFEVRTSPLPVGLGSHVHWDRRLEGEIARMLMSLNAIKGVEIGMGFAAAGARGSTVHDAIVWSDELGRGARATNRSGGIDGGMTTGEALVVRAAMKPLSTLMKPLPSIDLATGAVAAAHVERSDVCSVPAAAVIGESLVALTLADAILRRFGGDRVDLIRQAIAAAE